MPSSLTVRADRRLLRPPATWTTGTDDSPASAAAVAVGRRSPARLPAALVPRPARGGGQPVRRGSRRRAGRPRRGGGDRARGRRPDEREIGPFVDEIWASVPFPAHYQRVNERRRVDEMITALLAWDASTGRSVAATELTFNVPVPGTSRPVSVSGSIDRVDRSEDGRIHVVDFKTGRTAASAAATAEHPQLGIYQLAIRLGALDAVRHRSARALPTRAPRRGSPLATARPARDPPTRVRPPPLRTGQIVADCPAGAEPAARSPSGRRSSSTSRTGSPRACPRCASRPRSRTAGPGSTT